MKKFINKSIPDILDLSKEEILELGDLIPNNFHESMAFFMSCEKIITATKDGEIIRFIKFGELNFAYMPNSQLYTGVITKNFFSSIFVSSSWTKKEISFVKKIIAFLFKIKKSDFNLTLQESGAFHTNIKYTNDQANK